MRKVILFFPALSITILLGCTSVSSHTNSSEEFEGIITYHEVTKSLSGEFDIDDTAVLHYSHGSYVVIHSSKSPKYHAAKDYYFDNASIKLFQDNHTDSLHVFPLYFATEKLDSFKVKSLKEKVFSKTCEEIEVNTSYPEKDSTTYSVIRYVVSKGYLTADKKHFENWKLGFFNKLSLFDNYFF